MEEEYRDLLPKGRVGELDKYFFRWFCWMWSLQKESERHRHVLFGQHRFVDVMWWCVVLLVDRASSRHHRHHHHHHHRHFTVAGRGAALIRMVANFSF